MNVQGLSAKWVALHEALGIGAPLRDAKAHAKALEAVEALMETPGGIDGTPIAGLVALLADRIREFEARHDAKPSDADPIAVLNFLMDQHGLRQSDLPEIGSQGVVSEVLSGRRQLNVRQIRALADRFGTSVEAFMP